MEGLLIITLLTGFIGSIGFVVALGKRSPRRILADGEVLETEDFPYSRRHDFFSAAERSFYEMLRSVTPEHTVFAKVRLADLVYVNGSVSRQSQHLGYIDRKHIDFVVCDKNLVPVVAVEINDAPQALGDRRARAEYVEKVLAAASLPVVYVQVRRGYVMDEIHRLVSPYLRIGTMTL